VISINNLNVTFGGFNLFRDISLHISEKERVALVGKNGAGKSTLLKIISGLENPTSGIVSKKSGITLGYLPQEMEHAKDKSVLDEALTAYSEYFDLKKELDHLTEQLSNRTDYQSEGYNSLLLKISELNDRLHFLDTENPTGSAERALKGLGFSRDDLTRPTSTFSEGWNMRIELAKILLRKPDLLLLDEPTNHLDIESIQWLENFLENYPGALLLISHDRRFLDNVTKRTLDLTLGRIYDYKVSFTRYHELRKERIEQQRASYENQQKMIEKTEDFIERFRYKATKSNQVQSRIKQLEKLDRIEVDEEDYSKLSVKFPPAPRSGEVVIKARDLAMSYGTKVVFENVNILIRRGERVALAGKNGEGKSTFAKLVAKEIKKTGGTLELGHNVSMGYYAQNQEDLLDKEDTVLGTLDKIAVGDVRTKLRDILGAFLFRGEDVDKKVAVLSGGERSRLAMAKLILKPHNLLLLDEPTNHMDIKSKDVLKQAMKAYNGTIVIVSHDRDFLDGLVDKVYEFRDKKVLEHIGGIRDFLEKLKREQSENLVAYTGVQVTGSSDKERSEENSYKAQKQRERAEKRKKDSIKKCEAEIEKLENSIKEMEGKIAGQTNTNLSHNFFTEYEKNKIELERKLQEWEKLH